MDISSQFPIFSEKNNQKQVLILYFLAAALGIKSVILYIIFSEIYLEYPYVAVGFSDINSIIITYYLRFTFLSFTVSIYTFLNSQMI